MFMRAFVFRTLGFFGIPVPKEVSNRILKVGLVLSAIITVTIFGLKALGIQDYVETAVFGIPTSLSFWTLLMVVLFWLDANLYIRKHFRASENEYHMAAFTVAIMVIISVGIHEMGHGVMATLFGNPIHDAGISWWGAFVRPTATIFEMAPVEEIAIALAGPGTNILLGLIAIWIVSVAKESLPENAIQYFAVINLRLAKYNLFPVFVVLDGGKALEGALREMGVAAESMFWVLPLVGALIYLLYRFITAGTKPLEETIATL